MTQELEGCRPADGGYRGRVQEAVTSLQSSLVPSFARHVDTAAAGLQQGQDKVLQPGLPIVPYTDFLPISLQFFVPLNDVLTLQAMEENEFIEACRLVYDGVREVRRAVLSNRGEVGVGLLSVVNLPSLFFGHCLHSLVSRPVLSPHLTNSIQSCARWRATRSGRRRTPSAGT